MGIAIHANWLNFLTPTKNCHHLALLALSTERTVWLVDQVRQWLKGTLNTHHSMFVASHLVITVVAYLGCKDITNGWLVLNIWHNLQYLQFVWVQNLRRFAAGPLRPVDAPKGLVARLSQPNNAFKCFAVFLIVGGVVYQGLTLTGEQLAWLGMPTVLILHFTLSYHHYGVDGVIWKRQGFFEKILLRLKASRSSSVLTRN